MRFTGTEKATYPNGGLLGLVYILQIGFKNMLHAFFVLSFTDKGIQFIAQNSKGVARIFIVHIGNTFVEQASGGWVCLKKSTIYHVQPRLVVFICGNRYGKVVPAVIAIKQPVIVIFIAPWEKDEQPAFDHWSEFIYCIFDL